MSDAATLETVTAGVTAAKTAAAESYEPNTQSPALECDLVMKGGITSGVVYPSAVLEMAKFYRFRSIGGAGAGAIAAAFTAAAELGREAGEAAKLAGVSDQANCGFPGLESVRIEILDDKKKTVRRLFRTRDLVTKPLLDTLVQLTTFTSKLWLVASLPVLLVVHFWMTALVGIVAGAAVGYAAAHWLAGTFHGSAGYGLRGFIAAGAIAGALVAPLLHAILAVLFYLPRWSFFGLCRGYSKDDHAVLTSWLHERIERLAGNPKERGRPLTFADLAGKGGEGVERSIELKMMTSNLSHGQPYVFPRPRREGKFFIFNATEFTKLFPDDVVSYLTTYADAQPAGSVKLKAPYYFLPTGDDLPVIVATRMSLSFPFLLSAIPLYTIKPTAFAGATSKSPVTIGEEQLQPNWVSDGGLSSNFPIHFFDGFLPSRPTFGMNLNYLDDEFKPKGQTYVDPNAFSETRCNAPGCDEASATAPTPTAGSAAGADESDDDADQFDDDDDDDDGVAPAEATSVEEVTLPTLWDMRYAKPQWKHVRGLGGFVGAILGTAKDHRDNMQTMLPSYRERTVQIWLRRDEGGLNLAMPRSVLSGIDKKGRKAGEALCPPRKDEDAATRARRFNMRHHQWVRLRVLLAAMEPQLRSMYRRFPKAELYAKLLDEQWNAVPKWYKRRNPKWVTNATKRLGLLMQFFQQWAEVEPALTTEGKETFFSKRPPYPTCVIRVTPDV